MEIEIKTCCDCPFFTDTHCTCSLKAKKEKHLTLEDIQIPYIYSLGWAIPEWCPLKDESVLIKLKQKTPEEIEIENFIGSLEPDKDGDENIRIFSSGKSYTLDRFIFEIKNQTEEGKKFIQSWRNAKKKMEDL